MTMVPEIPESFKNKIREMGGGLNVVLVIQKELTHCDASSTHNRLCVPSQQIMNNFLNPEEEEGVVHGDQSMRVKLIQPCLRVTDVTFKNWRGHRRGFGYLPVLIWPKDVVMNPENALKPGTMVRLYAFRLQSNNELCFALVNLDLANSLVDRFRLLSTN